jgi:hypothetical protein
LACAPAFAGATAFATGTGLLGVAILPEGGAFAGDVFAAGVFGAGAAFAILAAGGAFGAGALFAAGFTAFAATFFGSGFGAGFGSGLFGFVGFFALAFAALLATGFAAGFAACFFFSGVRLIQKLSELKSWRAPHAASSSLSASSGS